MIQCSARYVKPPTEEGKLVAEIPLPQSIPLLEAVQLTDLLEAFVAHFDDYVKAWHSGYYPTPADVPWTDFFPHAEPVLLDEKWPAHTQEGILL